MSERAEQTQFAFEATAVEKPRQHAERPGPRFVWAGIVVTYAVVVALVVAIYFMIEGRF